MPSIDMRAKIVLLFAFSVSVLMVSSWAGLALLAACVAALCAASRLDVGKTARMLAPAVPFVAMAVLFGALNAGSQGAEGLASGVMHGLFLGLRLLVLLLASLLLCLTSTSSEQMEGLAGLMHPLRRVGVPVDDVAVTLSLALRFIPLTYETLRQIRIAQRSRCAHLIDGTVLQRLKANAQSFVPLFVALFRKADRVANAMDARCYGLKGERTSLNVAAFSSWSAAALIAGLVLCVCAVVVL